MYCTPVLDWPSSADDDVAAALRGFVREARILGTISHSVDARGRSAAAAYAAALREPTTAAWTAFVERTARLVDAVHDLDTILVLGPRERRARDFFAAIVHENADLLRAPAVATR